MTTQKIFFLIITNLLISLLLEAQPDSLARPTFVRTYDTTQIQFFFWNNPADLQPLSDTLLHHFQHYDPTRTGYFFDHLQLGDVGAPHQSFAFVPTPRRGFEVGLHLYDLYEIPYEQVRFFKTNKAYTEAYYSQASSQNDLIFKATFASRIGERGGISLDFARISEVGLYAHQKARHTNFILNGWFQSKNKRYQGLWAWLRKAHEQENNGGIESEDDLISGLFGVRSSVATNLTAAETQIRSDEAVYTHFFNLLPNTDNLQLKHRAVYQNWGFKFFDTEPNADFYKVFQTNERGLRQFIAFDKIENEATLRLQYKGSLDVGAVHSAYFVNQEPTDTTLQNLFLLANWDLQFDPRQRYQLNVKAHFGLLDNRADYLLQGNLKLNFGKIGTLTASAGSRGYSPTLLQHRLYVSQTQVWNNDNFSKTIENHLAARYDYPNTLSVAAHYYLLDRLVYWDTLGFARQTDTLVSIGQVMARLQLRFGKIHWDNAAVLQQVTGSLLRFPVLALKSSLYFEGNLFKNAAFLRAGFDVRYHTAYFADDFQPLTGQFFQQNQQSISILPIVDVFLNLQVKTFRGFVKVENLNNLVFNDEFYFTAPRYPMRDWTFRFGVAWRFADAFEAVQTSDSTSSPSFNNNGRRFDQ